MSKKKKDDVRKDGEKPTESRIEVRPVSETAPSTIVFPVGPAMLKRLREREAQRLAEKQKEAGGESGSEEKEADR